MELQPESDAQPAIRPTQFILHSIAAPWTARRVYEFWRDSTALDSHFGLGYEGDLAQFIGTETRADANFQANRRPDGTGAVSIETASNLKHTDPWTDAQVEQLIRLGVWLHQRHGIPLRVCRTASDPGYGYHRLHAAWSDGGTACPGDARVRQFKNVVFPGIVARASGQTPPTEEDPDMTPEEHRMLSELHADRVVGPWQYKGTLSRDAWAILRDTAANSAAAVNAVANLSAKVSALEKTTLTPDQIAAIADKVASSPVLAEQIAKRVVELYADRVAE
jgi:hypothetical protein